MVNNIANVRTTRILATPGQTSDQIQGIQHIRDDRWIREIKQRKVLGSIQTRTNRIQK